MRVLLVDDEISLATPLAQLLKQNHFTVDVAYDGLQGLDMARAGIYDLLMIDVMLPGLSGFDLVRTLREEDDATPILMLTARGTEEDKVFGLDSGADDYVVKPFGVNELLARARALTRRVGDIAGMRTLETGRYSLDLTQRTIRSGGDVIPLTHKEFQLMELFMRHRGQVLSRHVIFDRVWGYDTQVDSNVVETYVHFLRKKLARTHPPGLAQPPIEIQTVHGAGYIFQPSTAPPNQQR